MLAALLALVMLFNVTGIGTVARADESQTAPSGQSPVQSVSASVSVHVDAATVSEDGACFHHTHDASCGYVSEDDAVDCGHVHTEEMTECLKNICAHECSEEACGYVEGADCTHEHGETCSYKAAVEGAACGHGHSLEVCGVDLNACTHVHGENCSYVEAVEEQSCTHEHNRGCGGEENCNHEHDENCGYVAAVEGVECDHVHSAEECGVDVAVCTHEHDEDCGFVEAEEEVACDHEHNEDCGFVQAVECGHECSVESGCIVCRHELGEHDASCGYVAAADCQAETCEICSTENMMRYTFSVNVNGCEDYTVSWGEGFAEEVFSADGYVPATATVSFDGLTLNVSAPATVDGAPVTVSPVLTTGDTVDDITVYYDADAGVLADGVNSSAAYAKYTANTGSVSVSVSGDAVTLNEATGEVVAAKTGDAQVIHEIKGESGTVYARVSQNVTVEAASVSDVTIEPKNPEDWYTTAPTVTISFNAVGYVDKFTAIVDGLDEVTFKKDETGMYTGSKELSTNGSNVVSLKDVSSTIKIDTVAPVVSDVVKSSEKKQGQNSTTVKFKIQEATSGIQRVTLTFTGKDGETTVTYTGEELANYLVDGTYQITLDGRYKSVNVVAVDNAGWSSDGKQTEEVDVVLSVSYLDTKPVIYEENTYYNAGVQYTVSGAEEWTIVINGFEKKVSGETFTFTGEVDGQTVNHVTSVYAKYKNEVSETNTGSYYMDTVGPKLTITSSHPITLNEGVFYVNVPVDVDETGEVTAENETVTVTLTATLTDDVHTAKEPVKWSQEIEVDQDPIVIDLSIWLGQLQDTAGNNLASAALEYLSSNQQSEVYPLSVDDSKATGTVLIDRQPPHDPVEDETTDDETSDEGITDEGTGEDDTVVDEHVAPTITINVTGDKITKGETDVFYGSGIQFSVNVTDGADGSGVDLVEYKIVDVNGAVKAEDEYITLGTTAGSWTVDLTEVNGFESDEVKIYIRATDKAGNTRTVVRTIVVDNKNPVVTASYAVDGDGVVQAGLEAGSVATDKITYTYAVTDLYTDPSLVIQYTVAKAGVTETRTVSANKDKECVFALTNGETLVSVEILAEDWLGTLHQTTVVTDSELPALPLLVDSEVPTITVTTACDDEEAQTAANVDYYDAPLTYIITLKDSAKFYSYDVKVTLADGTTYTADLTSISDGLTLVESDYYTRTYAFTLNGSESVAVDGDILTGLTVNVQDHAGNVAEYKYEGNPIEIDTFAPVATITLPTDAVNTCNDVEYFDAEQDITVFVKDSNLCMDADGNPELKYEYVYSVAGKKTTVTEDMDFGWKAVDGGYEGTITVTDGQKFESLNVRISDYAGHTSSAKTTDTFVVDTTAPNVKIELSDNVIGAYTNNGTLYLKLNPVVSGHSGLLLADIEDVTVTITVSDCNISTVDDGEVVNVVKLGENSSGTLTDLSVVNTESSVVYTYTASVIADQTAAFYIDLQITDLAGNVSVANVPDPTVKDGETTNSADFNTSEGVVAQKIVVDRRRPTSKEDNVPVITLKNNDANTYTAVNGAELHTGSFTYSMVVTDKTKNDAGLASVEWWLEGEETGTITVPNNTQSFKKFTDEWSGNIAVDVNGKVEDNEIQLYVKAVDNVGNIITYVYDFAVDNMDPRVTVSYDNNDVRNDKYFRADRTVTVSVTDLNFNAETTKFDPAIDHSAWRDGAADNEHVATYTYNTDGEYTFSMSATDYGQNVTENGEVVYQGVATQEFVIDKTAPVIIVNYTNNDVRNYKYYNAVRTANIEIVETNFRSTDVNLEMDAVLAMGNAIPALGAWTDNGDSHTNRIPFLNDGDYEWSMSYTDLAGNPAVTYNSPEFTIDTVMPTVTITNVDNRSANKGSVEPIVTFGDRNFDNDGYHVDVTVLKGLQSAQNADLYSTTITTANGVEISYSDLESISENDGVYTINAYITDLAGNMSNATIMYSVNRFGSTYYAYDAATKALLEGKITNSAPELKIVEINPDKLTEHSVSLSVNGTVNTLVEGEDFSVVKSGVESTWMEYIYTIYSSAFETDGALVEGSYIVMLYSKDDAGNTNSNRTNVNSLNADFTIDTTAPMVSITGIDTEKSMTETEREITVYFDDSTAISKVEIYANGELIKVLEGEELAELNGEYKFMIQEDDDEQTLQVRVYDAAGNVTESDMYSFFLNSGFWKRFMYNKPLFYGSIAGVAGLLILIIILLLKRKKENEESTAAV